MRPGTGLAALLLAICLGGPAPEIDDAGPVADWPAYGADAGGTRHSPLDRIRRVPRAEVDAPPEQGTHGIALEPQDGTPYAVERLPLLSPDGAPCTPPPWGTRVGVDLAEGSVRWEIPLGTARGLVPAPVWWFAPRGMPDFGGPIPTASRLTFIAAATDRYLRAFETATGEELWRGDLPFAGHATPMTYRLREDARQYVVIAAGGHGLFSGPVGDAVVAFALPR